MDEDPKELASWRIDFGSSVARRAIAAIFVLGLCLPGLRMLAPVRDEDAGTLRFEATKPPPPFPRSVGAVARFPRDYVFYFNSHFGFRRPLMSSYAHLKAHGIAVSDSGTVIIGKDAWLYFGGENVIDDFRGMKPFTDAELERWAKLLVARRDWLRARNIPYVFLVAPNTHTIYPEHLPSWIVRSGRPTRLAQLSAYLKQHTDVDVVELAPALLAAKQNEQVYYRTDTHWNMLGAFVVYQQISAWMKTQFPAWRSFGRDDFVRTETPGWHGGLAYALGAPDLGVETRVDLVPREPVEIRTDGAPLPRDETYDAWTIRPVVVRECDTGEIPRAVIFRDSQMAAPAQYLSRHFRRAVLVWDNRFDPATIERERPNVVIQEVVERTLAAGVPEDPPLPP